MREDGDDKKGAVGDESMSQPKHQRQPTENGQAPWHWSIVTLKQGAGFNLPLVTNESLIGKERRRILKRTYAVQTLLGMYLA